MNPFKKYFQIFFLLLGCVLVFNILRIAFLIMKSHSLVKDAQAYQRIKPEAKLKILFIGDSTAVGTGAKDPRDSVAGRFGKDFPEAQIINLGINGESTHQLAQAFNPQKLSPCDLVVIQIGGNDIIRFTNLSNLEKDLDQLLSKVSRLSRKIVLLHSGNVGLAPFFPRYLEGPWRGRSLQVRSLFMTYAARYHAAYVNLFTERPNDLFLTDVHKYYSPDMLHPSGEGYGLWYKTIRETMERQKVRLE